MTKDETLKMAIKALQNISESLTEKQVWFSSDVYEAINACKEALEQQEIGDAEIKEMLDDIEWYQQEQRKLIDRIKALEQPAMPNNCRPLEEVIAEYEKDPAKKEALDKARVRLREWLEQPAQEPVAWKVTSNNGSNSSFCITEKQPYVTNAKIIPLYTHPHQDEASSSRASAWQGLTAKEITSIPLDEYALQKVEKILKEKNFG